MTSVEKLALLNKVKVVDDDGKGKRSGIAVIWVDLAKPILECMSQLGMSNYQIRLYVAKNFGTVYDEPFLDITDLGYEVCGAVWYEPKKGFQDELPEGIEP